MNAKLRIFCLAASLLLLSRAASAEIEIVSGEKGAISVGAYASNFTLGQHLDYDTAGLIPVTSGTNAALLRIETQVNLWTTALEIHNRFFWRASTAPTSLGLGLGATQAPERTVDLRSEIVGEPFLLEHDLDRLALSIPTSVADLTLGRQAITWGNNVVFPVADLWTLFSPFEADTSQKRGVDGVRAFFYPTDSTEIDVVVVDRGALEDLSGGVRIGWSLGGADFFGGLARNYETFSGLMGITYEFDSFRSHGAIQVPFDPDTGDLLLPRSTVGLDYFATEYNVILEYHFNGLGSDDSTPYLTRQSDKRIQRGELYLSGRHYVGFVGAYLPLPELTISASVLSNVTDPSALITPTISYALSDNTNASFGAYFGVGERPEFAPLPLIPSEFGAAGFSGFFQLTGFL